MNCEVVEVCLLCSVKVGLEGASDSRRARCPNGVVDSFSHPTGEARHPVPPSQEQEGRSGAPDGRPFSWCEQQRRGAGEENNPKMADRGRKALPVDNRLCNDKCVLRPPFRASRPRQRTPRLGRPIVARRVAHLKTPDAPRRTKPAMIRHTSTRTPGVALSRCRLRRDANVFCNKHILPDARGRTLPLDASAARPVLSSEPSPRSVRVARCEMRR